MNAIKKKCPSHCYPPDRNHINSREKIIQVLASRAILVLEQVTQRGGRCPIPGNIQGQVGRGSEQPGLVEDVPAHCREVGLDDL